MTFLSTKKLTVTNFRGVQGTIEIEFNQKPGLYYIAGLNKSAPRLGANDAGKSTLFCESYSWVINGRLSRSNRPGNDVVNWQSGSEPAGVVWEFSLDDKPHILARWRNPNKLVLDGVTVEQADVDKLLPLSDAALRKTLLLDQFGTMFLSLRPEEKSRIFSETLNLDVFIRSAERASVALKDVEALVDKHKIDVSQQTALLAETRDQLELAIKKEEQFEEERNRDIDRVRIEYRKAKAEMEEVTDKLNAARDAHSRVGKTDQRVRLNDLKLEERKLIQSIARLEADNESTSASIDRLEASLERYSDSNICPECGQVVTDKHVKEKGNDIKRRIDRIKEDFADAKIILVDSRKVLKNTRNSVKELEESLVEDEKAQSEVSKWAEVSFRCQRQVNGLREQLKELKGRENAFTGQCDRLEKRRKQLVTERKETRAALEKAESVAEVYKFWQKGFKEIRLEQIDTTLLELEIATNKHAEALGLEDWEIQFATDRETAKGTISHGFSVFLYPPGQKEPIAFENYAGGVSQRWQLATTSGLSEILLARSGIDTDFEIFDEPTTHLSSEGIDDLLECLRDRALTQKRRIYLIDHHVLDRGAFDGVFTVIKDKNGIRLENSVENA
jgi:DNA repair exonuclease SbcCD ATPase subunit